jgi:hypothetical protein
VKGAYKVRQSNLADGISEDRSSIRSAPSLQEDRPNNWVRKLSILKIFLGVTLTEMEVTLGKPVWVGSSYNGRFQIWC